VTVTGHGVLFVDALDARSLEPIVLAPWDSTRRVRTACTTVPVELSGRFAEDLSTQQGTRPDDAVQGIYFGGSREWAEPEIEVAAGHEPGARGDIETVWRGHWQF
jgi:hypothetical protein